MLPLGEMSAVADPTHFLTRLPYTGTTAVLAIPPQHDLPNQFFSVAILCIA